MRNLLDEIWAHVQSERDGDEEIYYKEDYKGTFSSKEVLRNYLYSILDDNQKDFFERYENVCESVNALDRKETFVIGARLAMRFIIETTDKPNFDKK